MHALRFFVCLITVAATPLFAFAAEPQYKSEGIEVVAAAADEAVRSDFSLDAAKDYLEKGSVAWTKSKKCVACHTNGTYFQMAPALADVMGQPLAEQREFLVKEVAKYSKANIDTLKTGIRPTQVAYMAHGLATWDKYSGDGKLSEETKQALNLMLSLQSDDGSWGNLDCWPPFESSSYQGATVAALALSTAPGFLDNLTEEQAKHVDLLKKYLRTQDAPHDYGRVLLLWAANEWDGLLTEAQKLELVSMAAGHQQDDGGWAMRTFATPETWGGGGRAEKLKTEEEFKSPPSDGHQTGLVIMVLRDAGVPADDDIIKRGIKWIKSNQRESGRWWTRSLNTDGPHFITYSGTFYPLMALHKCGELK
ncbi:MAG: hypothetical protein MK006_17180 [Pirellulales bacterium]|nr:hypothetical protein [Pirellulales bacterium]